MINVDMNMPKTCRECRFMYESADGIDRCAAMESHDHVNIYADSRDPWCPLQEVKKNG